MSSTCSELDQVVLIIVAVHTPGILAAHLVLFRSYLFSVNQRRLAILVMFESHTRIVHSLELLKKQDKR